MGAVNYPKPSTDNIIQLAMIDGKLGRKPVVKYNKDGTIDKRHPNKVAGESSEVYPFVNEEEIKAMINLFNKRIEKANTENRKMIAKRNKMLFVIGINVGLRASDLCSLKWNFFFDDNMEFRKTYKIQPKKTKKYGKYVTLFFNDAIEKIVTDYVKEYPIEDMDDYLFKSQKGDGYITEIVLGRIIKKAAKEIGIDRNINSHSLRKTFGKFAWNIAEDKEKALIELMIIFNHSSTAVTKKYIGVMSDDIESVFNSLNLGLDYLD